MRCELWQMLRDAQSGRFRRDGAEFAANCVRCVRLRVEALVLRQPAGEEDVDHALGGRLPFSAQQIQFADAKTEQPDSSGLNRVASGDSWMCEHRHGKALAGLLQLSRNGAYHATGFRALAWWG